MTINTSSNTSTATQDLGKLRRQQYIALIPKRVRPGSGSNLAFMQSRTWAYPVADLNRIIQETPFPPSPSIEIRLPKQDAQEAAVGKGFEVEPAIINLDLLRSIQT